MAFNENLVSLAYDLWWFESHDQNENKKNNKQRYNDSNTNGFLSTNWLHSVNKWIACLWWRFWIWHSFSSTHRYADIFLPITYFNILSHILTLAIKWLSWLSFIPITFNWTIFLRGSFKSNSWISFILGLTNIFWMTSVWFFDTVEIRFIRIERTVTFIR